jgi:long-chain acyl-CoA synthetase
MTLYHSILEFPKRNGVGIEYFENGQLKQLKWTEYYEQVKSVTSALFELGVKKQSRIAIMANTCLKWGLTDLAVQSLGAVIVPIYHNSTSDEIEHILNDSETTHLFIESLRDLNHLKKDSIAKLKIISFSDGLNEILSWSEFIKLTKLEDQWFESLVPPKIEDLATIVYTSGTTGLPKGVCLSHLQIVSEVKEAFSWGITKEDKTLCFLPMAHVLGRVEFWAHVYWGFELAFAESIERLKKNLTLCKPTVFIAVPRVFEKFYEAIFAQMETLGIRKRIFERALKVGEAVSSYTMYQRKVPLLLALEFELAEALIFRKIKEVFGGRLRFAVSGGAPLNPQISTFFHHCGILILEGYGLTETTAAICVNRPTQYVMGTVGLPVGDVKIKIAEDGEILIKSDKVMTGYYKLPDETKKVLKNGWLATGDIGEILPTGELKITDRKKDLIKTSGGKYVAPQKIESFAKESSLISNVVIYGDQKKYVVALISLSEKATQYSKNEIEEKIRNHIAQVNSELAGYESVKKFALTQDQWTVENGLLTPSLKVKRKKLIENYKSELDALYS